MLCVVEVHGAPKTQARPDRVVAGKPFFQTRSGYAADPLRGACQRPVRGEVEDHRGGIRQDDTVVGASQKFPGGRQDGRTDAQKFFRGVVDDRHVRPHDAELLEARIDPDVSGCVPRHQDGAPNAGSTPAQKGIARNCQGTRPLIWRGV